MAAKKKSAKPAKPDDGKKIFAKLQKEQLLVFAGILKDIAKNLDDLPVAVAEAVKVRDGSLENLKINMNTFASAALATLELAFIKQIDMQFEATKSSLVDSDGKVIVEKYDAEIAAAEAARKRDRAKVAEVMTKFNTAMQDLDNAMALNAPIGKYMDKKRRANADFCRIVAGIMEGMAEALVSCVRNLFTYN